ncbi:MAG: hypothetical protein WAO76_08070, partial [Georgfuchsia sp.]
MIRYRNALDVQKMKQRRIAGQGAGIDCDAAVRAEGSAHSGITWAIGAARNLLLPYSIPRGDTRGRVRRAAKATGDTGYWGWRLHPVVPDTGNLFFRFDDGVEIVSGCESMNYRNFSMFMKEHD